MMMFSSKKPSLSSKVESQVLEASAGIKFKIVQALVPLVGHAHALDVLTALTRSIVTMIPSTHVRVPQRAKSPRDIDDRNLDFIKLV